MNLRAIPPTLAATPDPLARIESQERLRETTREFESLFLEQMLAAMRRTVPQSGFLGQSDGEQVFRSLLDRELAREMAHAGGCGIGDLLYQQLASERGETSPLKLTEDENDAHQR